MSGLHGALRRLAVGVAVLSVALAACGDGHRRGDARGLVNIAINPWVGYEANAAVVGVLLERLGYKVATKALTEERSWEGFETGDVDVIVENWGHADLKQRYIDERRVAVFAGETGNTGIIGWYVPGWMAEQYPDITDWRTLNRYARLFQTTASGDRGQFLAGDPSFVTHDAALIANLHLDFRVVHAGSEAAVITAFRTATAQRTPLLAYFYEPQWLHAKVPLVRIALPPFTPGCDADPEKVACGTFPAAGPPSTTRSTPGPSRTPSPTRRASMTP